MAETPNDRNAWVAVYDFVKENIIRGIYSPGERLNEREIARMANVSRTPVREAVRVLEHDGFVTNVEKKVLIVKKYSPEELDMLHRMLMLLEKLAVEMATPKLSARDISSLEKMTSRLSVSATKGRFSEYLTLNFEFHLFFARTTGNAELLDTISHLRKKIFRFTYAHITMDGKYEQYVKDHEQIVEALKGKVDGVPGKLMEKHVDRGRRAFLEFYRKFQR